MTKVIRKIINWKMMFLLFWLFILFLVISQPGYTIVPKYSAVSVETPVNSDPYTIPVVLKSEQQAMLSSLMDGYIEELTVKEGDHVKQDQLLLSFDCNIQHAQHDKTLAQLDEASSFYLANMRLKHLGAISDPEVEKSKLALAEATADLAIKKELIDYCQIKAPFDGTIVKMHIRQFQTINRNVELLELLDNSSLKLELIAPSNWLSWLEQGYKFKIDIAEINKSYPAVITSILPKIDAISQTVRLIAEIDGDSRGLIAGMNGRAHFKR